MERRPLWNVPGAVGPGPAAPTSLKARFNAFYLNNKTNGVEIQVIEVEEQRVRTELIDFVLRAWGGHPQSRDLMFFIVLDMFCGVMIDRQGLALYSARELAKAERALAEAEARS